MSYFSTVNTQFADSGSIDAFSRQRVSLPVDIFDAQFTYNLSPLQFEVIASGSGATVTHDATDRNALMTFASTPTGGKAFMQSYDYMPYQPGSSQLIFLTFNFVAQTANVLKFAGYSDGVNGIEFQNTGTGNRIVLYSSSSDGNDIITQANWNVDKLDGTGISQITLDITKSQILVIDLQALYVGRVRVGFDIGGTIYWCHYFNHANIVSPPYIATANLPIRCGMTCTGTVSSTMRFQCSAVRSERATSLDSGRSFTAEGAVTAASGAQTHILSIRPRLTFNSFTNRVKFQLDNLALLVTGNNSVRWDLVIGQAITGTTAFTDVNTAYSAFAFNTAGTISGSPALVIASGYSAATNQAAASADKALIARYPITLDQAGAVRALGTLSLLVTGIGGVSACRAALNWGEIR